MPDVSPTAAGTVPSPSPYRWGGVLPWLIFALCMALTLVLYRQSGATVEQTLAREFEFRSEEVLDHLQQRLQGYEQVLRGGAALFAASDEVSRGEFRIYVEQLHLRDTYPGIQGVGFARLLQPDELPAHVSAVREEGFPDYAVRPDGRRELYTAIVYLEPFDARNQRAFGYDMYSEPVRRAAMQQAWETGGIGISGKVRLLQEDGVSEQAGFLVYVPVYREIALAATEDTRRGGLLGWVYAPFRMHDFMRGSLGDWLKTEGASVNLRVYDGEQPLAGQLLFDSAAADEAARTDRQPAFRSTRILDEAGHRWLLEMSSQPAFDARLQAEKPRLILLLGLLISSLLTWITWLLVQSRQQAVRLAAERNERFVESEARFRTIADAAPVMIWMSDARDENGWCNRGWRDLIGETAGAPVLAAIRERVHPAERVAYDSRVGEGLAAQRPYSLEYRLRTSDGEYRWLLETGLPRRTSGGDFVGFIACTVDISEQKKQAELLEGKRQELEALFLSAPDGVILVDDAGCIAKVNTRFSRLTGYSEREILGESIDLLLPERYRGAHRRQVMGYMAAPQTRPMAAGKDLFARRKDGSEFPADISLSPVMIDDQPYVIATVRDVTERAQIKQALSSALDDAEAASRAKGAFLANMSHEIRTPLNGVLGMAELTLATELDPVQRQYLEMLKASADGLLVVVNDILDFSKIEAGQMRMESLPFDICASLCNVAKSLSNMALDKGINLACEIAPDVPSHVVGDPARLRQVLWNLLGNALKFTASGEVLVTVELAPCSDPTQVGLQVSVRDTGIGISDDKLEAIFENFVQADDSTTRQYGGTGLGLTICRHLVGMMGGRVWAESTPGEGSVFHFTARFGVASTEIPLWRERLEGLQVLVVDDHPTNRRIYREMLQAHGVSSVMACDGMEALVWLEGASLDGDGRPCDMILLDARMPGMNGLEFVQRLARRERWRDIPVIMLSSGSIEGDVSPENRPVLAAHLIKPVCRDELLDAMAGVLQSGSGGVLPPAAPEAEMATPRRVLVVDDNVVGRIVASTALRKRGHEVVEAADGLQAVEEATRAPFDVILMDMQMPGMDGMQATRAIRAHEAAHGGHVLIIALTANAMAEDQAVCAEAGMDGFLSKPVSPPELVKAVEGSAALPLPGGAADHEVHTLAEQLRLQSGGDDSLALALIDACLQDLPPRLAQLARAFDGGDAAGLRQAAHVLKGMLVIFAEGSRLIELLQAAEELGVAGQSGDAALRTALWGALDQFERDLSAVRRTLLASGDAPNV